MDFPTEVGMQAVASSKATVITTPANATAMAVVRLESSVEPKMDFPTEADMQAAASSSCRLANSKEVLHFRKRHVQLHFPTFRAINASQSVNTGNGLAT